MILFDFFPPLCTTNDRLALARKRLIVAQVVTFLKVCLNSKSTSFSGRWMKMDNQSIVLISNSYKITK